LTYHRNISVKRVEVTAFTIEDVELNENRLQTHFASERALAKDWLNPEEEAA
jgi:hypothetical protein